MKKRINGKTYNTETATLIADDWYRLSDSERFNNGVAFTLFRRPRGGEYFLLRETLWSYEVDEIIPVSYEEAREAYRAMKRKWEEFT